MGDFLFGSDSKTKQYSSLGDRSKEGQQAIDILFPGAANQYNQGIGLVGTGVDWLHDLATKGTNGYVQNADDINQQLIGQQTNQNIGSTTNSMAKNGVINSTMMQNALADIGSNANQQALAAHQQNLANAYNLGHGFLQSGTGLQSGLIDFSKLQEMLRQNANQTVQAGGSPGLVGSFVGGLGGAAGKKWFG